MSETRLTRSQSDQMIAGVCGGLSQYLRIDSSIVRLAMFVLVFASGIGLIIYFTLWLLMPGESSLENKGTDILQDNFGEMGDKLSTGVSRLSQKGTVGILLILCGAYFLLEQIGWLSGLFFPLVIIGAGVYMLLNRS